MKDGNRDTKGPNGNGVKGCQEWDIGSGSFSSQFMTRNQDISFGIESPINDDMQSPAFTCRTSFSSFLVEPSKPSLSSAGFSFCSPVDSNALEFASPLSSTPGFAFFSPGSVAHECSSNISGVDSVHGGN